MVNNAKIQIIKEYANYYGLGNLLPAVAEDLSRCTFQERKDLIALRGKYFNRFKKALPVVKVAQFFQIDSKLQTVIDFQLSSAIPLAK